MLISFYLVVLNHHQACLADELYALLGSEFHFVELTKDENNQDNKGSLQDYSARPYLIRPWLDENQQKEAEALLEKSDVCVFGGVDALPYMRRRLKAGKLTYYVSERWLKRGLFNILSPRLLKVYCELIRARKRPLYLLCASAFAAKDFKSIGICNQCYKWGYFIETQLLPEHYRSINEKEVPSKAVSIMWCSRFIDWKHPELAIELARRLKKQGYDFILDMYGDGQFLNQSKDYCIKLDLNDRVRFKGSESNDRIIQAMQQHEIFILTSDKNEGWGVVLNEAMGSGCAVVASNATGAAPYLIEDNISGMMFESNNIDSLYEKVVYLIENPDERSKMAAYAHKTLSTRWSPKTAALNLVHLSTCLMNGQVSDIKEGPGSFIDD